jgi:hypothetical protein
MVSRVEPMPQITYDEAHTMRKFAQQSYPPILNDTSDAIDRMTLASQEEKFKAFKRCCIQFAVLQERNPCRVVMKMNQQRICWFNAETGELIMNLEVHQAKNFDKVAHKQVITDVLTKFKKMGDSVVYRDPLIGAYIGLSVDEMIDIINAHKCYIPEGGITNFKMVGVKWTKMTLCFPNNTSEVSMFEAVFDRFVEGKTFIFKKEFFEQIKETFMWLIDE